jgi:hypothetical protein
VRALPDASGYGSHHGTREVGVAAGKRPFEAERLLTPAEVAELFKVNPLTVTRCGRTKAASGRSARSAGTPGTRKRRFYAS